MDYSEVLSFLCFLIMSSTVDAANYPCSTVCRCSSEKFDALGDRDYFVLSCFGDAYRVENASRADVYVYNSSEPLDTNFLSSFYNLKGLMISNGQAGLATIPPIVSLRLLDIENGNTPYLPPLQLYAISASLLRVSLTRCRIEYVSDEAFAKLDGLRHLNLSHNVITSLSGGVFYSLRNLKSLDLSHNRLYRLSLADLNGLDALSWLDISGNSISFLETLKFNQRNVTVLSEANPLTGVGWIGGSDISRLSVSSPTLVVLRRPSFRATVIETLTISRCSSLTMIEAGTFVNVTILALVLSNNPSLKFIDRDAFASVDKLGLLDLSFNSLSVVPDLSARLGAMYNLSVRGNPLVCDCNVNWMVRKPEAFGRAPIEETDCLAAGTSPTSFGETCAPRAIYVSEKNITVDEGQTLRILCKVSGIPVPSIGWTYGGSRIPNVTSIQIGEDLILDPVRYANAGLYQCLAANSEGKLRQDFRVTVNRDDSKIIILSIGKTTVEFSWRVSDPQLRYQAIIINVKNNTQAFYPLQQFPRSRHTQSLIIRDLQKSTTYRICLAFENQVKADSYRCETVTTLSHDPGSRSSNITDYSVYGVVIASFICFLIIAFIVCVCLTTKRHVRRRRKENMAGALWESSHHLLTTSFSQRSHLSAMFDNAGAIVHTPMGPTPTGLYPPGAFSQKLRRTNSEPTISCQADTQL